MGYFYKKYRKEIEQNWDFDKIEKEALSNCYFDDDGNIVASCFLGTVFAIAPSGKYWTWWASSNVDIREQIRDNAFMEAFSDVFESKNMYITGGEGDPCDLFAQFTIELDDVEELGAQFIAQEDFEKYLVLKQEELYDTEV